MLPDAERDNPMEAEILCEGSAGTAGQRCLWEDGRKRQEKEGDMQCSGQNRLEADQEAALAIFQIFDSRPSLIVKKLFLVGVAISFVKRFPAFFVELCI